MAVAVAEVVAVAVVARQDGARAVPVGSSSA